MYDICDKTGKVTIRLWIPIDKIESTAMQQIQNMARHPRVHGWVAIMPDVHTGIGATIGAVLPMDGVLIPAAVGVDIGCGMCAVRTDLNTSEVTDSLKEVHRRIAGRIPLGFEHRASSQMKDVYLHVPKEFQKQVEPYARYGKSPTLPQLGTLGGGNHFIELQKDKDNTIWILLHSGSRNIGNLLATDHIKLARKLIRKKRLDVPQGLDYLEENSPEGRTYIDDMHFAMEFARQNRFAMIAIVKSILQDVFGDVKFGETINIHHNYAAKEEHLGKKLWIHRKGATRVKTDITGIIPGSMATPSYIVKGTDNVESFNSCSHGAGRVMSRTEARRVVDLEEFRQKMIGIYSESINRSHLDEAPDAYKEIDWVMEHQRDLVVIQIRLEPVLNIKG